MPYTDSPACDPFFSQAPKRTMYRQLEGTRYHSRPTYCHPTTTGNTSRVPLSKHAICSSRPRRSLLCLRATHQRKTTPAETGTSSLLYVPSPPFSPVLPACLVRVRGAPNAHTHNLPPAKTATFATYSVSIKQRIIRYSTPSTKNAFSIEQLSPVSY